MENEKLTLTIQNPHYHPDPFTVDVYRDPERGRVMALVRGISYCRAYIVGQTVFAWRANSEALHNDVLAALVSNGLAGSATLLACYLTSPREGEVLTKVTPYDAGDAEVERAEAKLTARLRGIPAIVAIYGPDVRAAESGDIV